MNIASRITKIASQFPNKVAVKYPHVHQGNYHYDELSFSELENRINCYVSGLQEHQFQAGDKVLIFVRPSLVFHALVFAAFKLGLIPIFIDPGMGRKNLLNAVKEIKPDGLIAEPEVYLIKTLFYSSFKSVKKFISTGTYPFWRVGKIKKFNTFKPENTQAFEWDPHQLSAILFTSGGTGKPKGVVYTQDIFSTQTDLLQELFHLDDKEIDLPGFPLFSLFTLSMGMTSVIPDMNPAKPSQANPEKLVKNILDNNVTFVAGSPAIWKPLAKYCLENNIKLPSVKYLVMFGAPVPNWMHEDFAKILTNGNTYTPYGATESLPIANISGAEVLGETALLTDQGKGTCVGYPVSAIEVKIIEVSDKPLKNIEYVNELLQGEIGEIIVKGRVVTPEYLDLADENEKSKIQDRDGFWHRIGDLGYLDDMGRLWFCGRKAHRVEIEVDQQEKMLCSVPCEAIFNHHPCVEKTALVGIGKRPRQLPALVVQMKKGVSIDQATLKKELLLLAKKHELTKDIKNVAYHDNFPVDIRHNIKIDRKKLARHAARSLV